MNFDLSINLGQVLTVAGFIVAVVWAHIQQQARLDTFMETLLRHEKWLDRQDGRLQEHGERIASMAAERRH